MGGRGLCVGVAELTNEMRAEAKLVWIMLNEEEVRESENRAGKAALSRPKQVKNLRNVVE